MIKNITSYTLLSTKQKIYKSLQYSYNSRKKKLYLNKFNKTSNISFSKFKQNLINKSIYLNNNSLLFLNSTEFLTFNILTKI